MAFEIVSCVLGNSAHVQRVESGGDFIFWEFLRMYQKHGQKCENNEAHTVKLWTKNKYFFTYLDIIWISLVVMIYTSSLMNEYIIPSY